MKEEGKNGDQSISQNRRRIFGVVLRGEPEDFQRWLDSAKVYDLYIVFSKSSRNHKLVIVEEPW